MRMLSSWKGTGGAWTWRVVDSELRLDRHGFDVTRNAQSKPWCCALGGAHLQTGFHEWEIRLTGNTRAVRVGVVARDITGVHDNLAWGRHTPKAWVLTDMGSLWHNEKLTARCQPFRTSGDIITMYCDMDTQTLRFAINGVKQPDAGFNHLPTAGVLPVVCFRESPVTAEMRHVISTVDATDTGPILNSVPVRRGQIEDFPKNLPMQYQQR